MPYLEPRQGGAEQAVGLSLLALSFERRGAAPTPTPPKPAELPSSPLPGAWAPQREGLGRGGQRCGPGLCEGCRKLPSFLI